MMQPRNGCMIIDDFSRFAVNSVSRSEHAESRDRAYVAYEHFAR